MELALIVTVRAHEVKIRYHSKLFNYTHTPPQKLTPGFDPTQVDWNNPDVEYMMTERAMADRRFVLLTKSNNFLSEHGTCFVVKCTTSSVTVQVVVIFSGSTPKDSDANYGQATLRRRQEEQLQREEIYIHGPSPLEARITCHEETMWCTK